MSDTQQLSIIGDFIVVLVWNQTWTIISGQSLRTVNSTQVPPLSALSTQVCPALSTFALTLFNLKTPFLEKGGLR